MRGLLSQLLNSFQPPVPDEKAPGNPEQQACQSLTEAANKGAWDEIIYDLETTVDAHDAAFVQEEKTKNTFLHIAVEKASSEDWRRLLAWPANTDDAVLTTLLSMRNHRGKTVWHLALEQKDPKEVIDKIKALMEACHYTIT